MLIEQQWPEIPAPIDAAVFYDGSYIIIPLLLLFYSTKCTFNKKLGVKPTNSSHLWFLFEKSDKKIRGNLQGAFTRCHCKRVPMKYLLQFVWYCSKFITT